MVQFPKANSYGAFSVFANQIYSQYSEMSLQDINLDLEKSNAYNYLVGAGINYKRQTRCYQDDRTDRGDALSLTCQQFSTFFNTV